MYSTYTRPVLASEEYNLSFPSYTSHQILQACGWYLKERKDYKGNWSLWNFNFQRNQFPVSSSGILISRGTDSRLNDGLVVSMFPWKFKTICLTMFWKSLSLMFGFNIMLTSKISYFSVAIDVDSYFVVIT